MKIQHITPYNFAKNNNIQKRENNNSKLNSTPQLAQSEMPSFQNYLSFTGGYSLNLAKTIERLDILAQKKSNLYPPNIREWAGMVLESGNKENKTLINIHKKFYESLKDCFSIEEVKKKFPEFKDVLSDKDVEFSKDSIVHSIKKGELEFFDKDEDISLQLLKLYWGDGFSLNDLKKYTNGTDLYHTIKKFKIPTVDRDYGHVLKMSDPEYNERLTREMTAKRLASLDRKAQELSGEPVYIKRGPLSAEHRQHISEGLKKYYQENPEKIYAMSERQREFYVQNPEKSEELARVLKVAWNIFGADRIKSALSKFMKKNGVMDFNPESSPINLPEQQSKLLQKFWGVNEWARKSFSKNMMHAWKKIKEENEATFYFRTVPSQLEKYIKETTDLDPETLNFSTEFNPFIGKNHIDEASNNEVTKYINKLNGLENIMADTFQISIFTIITKLKDMRKRDKVTDSVLNFATSIVKNNTGRNGYKIQTTAEAQNDYATLAAFVGTTKRQDLVDVVNNAVDKSFELALFAHPEFVKANEKFINSILK